MTLGDTTEDENWGEGEGMVRLWYRLVKGRSVDGAESLKRSLIWMPKGSTECCREHERENPNRKGICPA